MINYRSVVFCFVLSAVVALAGCSSKTAQPDVPSTASASPPAGPRQTISLDGMFDAMCYVVVAQAPPPTVGK